MAGLASSLRRESGDRRRALDAAIGQIERAFGKGSVMKLGQRERAVEIDTISTGSLGLDLALGVGGLPRDASSRSMARNRPGKTTLTLHCIAEAQKAGGVVRVRRRRARARSELRPSSGSTSTSC